jgi:signal transduction histidine kinase
LTAAISHELRTPAAVIAGYVDALRRDEGDRERDLDTIAHEAQRLQAILNDLLTVSQAEAGRLSLTLTPTDLGAAVERAVQTFAPLAWEGQKVQVVAEVEPGLPPVPADELRLGQVLANLLHNALRHTPPGGVVAAAAARHGGAVRLSVSDTGEGIPPADLPHLWDRFYQSSDPAHRPAAGAGLGLALVKELSDAMGATVGVESVMGEGSTFWVEF